VLLARDGHLYRVPVNGKTGPTDPIEVADLRAMKFEAIESPPEALTWAPRRKKKISIDAR
jgi:hypothetical protein